MLNIGDSVGAIYDKTKDSEKWWELVEDKIVKIDVTKKHGRRYHTKSRFYPLDAEDVDCNTKIMEDISGGGGIFVRDVFGLNEVTRPFAERWVEWANENQDKVMSLWDKLSQ